MGSDLVLLKVFLLTLGHKLYLSFLTVLTLSDATFKPAFAQNMRNKPGYSCTWASNTVCWQDRAFSAAEKGMLFGSFLCSRLFCSFAKDVSVTKVGSFWLSAWLTGGVRIVCP